MTLSIRQYAFFFTLLTVMMIGAYTYYSYQEFNETRTVIRDSQRQAAASELARRITLVNIDLAAKTEDFSSWDETRQQLDNPQFFSYWYKFRLQESLHPLRLLTLDIMLYDRNGLALAQLEQNRLPQSLSRLPQEQALHLAAEDQQIYIQAITGNDAEAGPLGYVAAAIDIRQLLRQDAHFYYLLPESLAIRPALLGEYLQAIEPEIFTYSVSTPAEIGLLEGYLAEALTKLVVMVFVPVLMLYFLLVFIVSVPINGITRFIQKLRLAPETTQGCIFKGLFQVRELKEVCNSLFYYHSDLYETHAILDQKNRALWDQAHHDALSGAYNRRAFDEQWQNITGLLGEQRITISFMLFDINLFKSINDTYGHQVGDQVIKAIADCIMRTLRKGENLYRLGGDEFATFLIDTHAEAAAEVARRCLAEISRFDFSSIDMPEPVRISVGIASASGGHVKAFEELHWQADAAMYTAKKPGNDDVVIFSDDLSHESKGLLSSWLSSLVYQAIDKGTGLVLFYQPIVDLRSGEICYYEALTRIYSGNELIPASSIFNLVEARRFETEMDRAVIRRLQQDLMENRIPAGTGVSLNLSAPTLLKPEVVDWLEPLQPFTRDYKIVIEVTETALITEITRVTRHLNQLRSRHFVIALDDFGSGYSSIKYLASMPVDIIKFDISIIQDLLDKKQRGMIERLAQMISEAGHQLVAEGIEDAELLAIVMQAGFEFGQGYLFARAEEKPATLLPSQLQHYFK